MGDKEVKGANSVKDRWKLLTQERPAAEISWIIQLNKLSGQSIRISSSWATVWCGGKSLSWAGRVEGGHFRDHQPSWRTSRGWSFKHPNNCTEPGAGAAQGSGFGWGEQSWQLSAAVSLLWEQRGSCDPGNAPQSSAGWVGQGGDGSALRARRGRNERGNHNCK